MAKLFYSYSHQDEQLRKQLEAHLTLLRRQGLIEAWHDRCLVAGDNFGGQIDIHLEAADIVLLLVSADFLASEYCYSIEMRRAMARHEAGEARVIPVILRHCDWHGAPFGALLAVPSDGKPVMAWADRDEALTDVARQVRKAVESLRESRAKPAAEPAAMPGPKVEAAPPGLPRSANTRIKQAFTEKDADDFIRASFDFICQLFEGSVQAAGEGNPAVSGHVERIDSRRMAAVLYRNGSKITECSVRIERLGRSNGIAFSHDSSAAPGSFNEMLNVQAGDHALHFTAIGMAWSGKPKENMDATAAANFLWDLFVRQGQI